MLFGETKDMLNIIHQKLLYIMLPRLSLKIIQKELFVNLMLEQIGNDKENCNQNVIWEEIHNIIFEKISKNIRCLICQGQSVYDSQSDFALSMKLVIEKKLNEGLKEKEIYEYLIDQYGQWITYDPEFNQKTLILWTLPILLFIIGGAIIFRKLIVLK